MTLMDKVLLEREQRNRKESNHMGTRGHIARATGKDTWTGVYHHWDSYPSGLGRTLYSLYRTRYQQNMGAMLSELITQHPAGWSTLVDADWSQPIGFRNYGHEGNGPQCYCHGDRDERAQRVTQDLSAGAEYAYVLDPDTHTMTIYERKLVRVAKAKRRVRYAAPQDYDYTEVWHMLAIVDLEGPEPNWCALQGWGEPETEPDQVNA